MRSVLLLFQNSKQCIRNKLIEINLKLNNFCFANSNHLQKAHLRRFAAVSIFELSQIVYDWFFLACLLNMKYQISPTTTVATLSTATLAECQAACQASTLCFFWTASKTGQNYTCTLQNSGGGQSPTNAGNSESGPKYCVLQWFTSDFCDGKGNHCLMSHFVHKESGAWVKVLSNHPKTFQSVFNKDLICSLSYPKQFFAYNSIFWIILPVFSIRAQV